MKIRLVQNALWDRGSRLMILAGLTCLFAVPAFAQSDDGFTVREDGQARASNDDRGAANNADTPVRLARFSFVEGNVSFRLAENQAWSSASINLPIRQGAQIWVEGKGRAELQFDDGSLLRMGSHALATLQTLFSDTEGTFSEVKVHEGLVTLTLRNKLAVYQLDSPYASVKAAGPGRIRLGVGTTVEVAIQKGNATIEGAQGSFRVTDGDYILLESANTPFRARRMPREDSWDRWNRERDGMLDSNTPGNSHLPSNIAIVANDLDSYGSWRNDDDYGQVWCPRVTSTWRPYSEGRWVWVHPFGWTWVSSEPWGWAPYHYGTWVSRPWGWGWVPGPVTQCWSPAVVHFYQCNTGIAWVPLCPNEVYYPRARPYFNRMGHNFSVLHAGVYYPVNNQTCSARPYNNTYINNTTYIDASTHYGNQRPGALSADRINFWARNSKTGGSFANARDFAGNGNNQSVTEGVRASFARAHVTTFANGGRQPLAGPANLAPTNSAISTTRIVQNERRPQITSLERPIYRTQLPTSVERTVQNRGGGTLSASERLNTLRNSERSTQAPSPGGAISTPNVNRVPSTPRVTTEIPRGVERTKTEQPAPAVRETTSAEQAARRARESVRGGSERRSDTQVPSSPSNETPRRDVGIPVPRQDPAPRVETPRRDTTPAPAPRPIERTESPRRDTTPVPNPRPIERAEPPRRDTTPAPAPRPIERPRQEAPSVPRYEPPARRESPPPAPRYEPPARRESPPPAPRYEPPARRESPPPAPRYEPPARRESPPPRQESPSNPRERERGRGRG